MSVDFQLSKDAFGKLQLTTSQGERFSEIRAVRAFPIQAPDSGISLVLLDGKEVAWIDHLNDLSDSQRALLLEELNGREFMPEIQRIITISSFATPSTWTVETNRGITDFVLKGDEDIRRVGTKDLLISDNHGIHFLIRDWLQLDRHSKKILDRFM